MAFVLNKSRPIENTEPRKTGLRQLATGVLRIAGGTTLGHAITLVATPFIAKLYGPESFGIWAGWLALAGLLATVACLRYETAIALPEDDTAALHVAVVAVLLALGVSAAGGILVLALWWLEVPGPWQRLDGYVIWVPLGALVIAWVGVATQWLARSHHVTGLAKAKVWSSGGTALIQLLFGYFGGAWGLILGDIAGRTVGLWGRVSEAWQELSPRIQAIRFENLMAGMRDYRTHSAWLTPTALVDALGLHAPLLLMIHWHGDALGGQFSLVQRLMAVPVALLGQSVSQLFLPLMAKDLRNPGSGAWRMFLGVSAVLATSAVVLIAISWTVEERWLIQILGHKWDGVGRFLLPCSIVVGMKLIVSPVSQTAIALGAQRWFSLWVLVWTSVSITGMYLGHRTGSPEGAVWGLAIASGIGYSMLWLGLLWGLRRAMREQNRKQQ